MPGSFLEDDLKIFTDPDVFGTTATWTPTGGSAVPDIDGIFDDLKTELNPYSGQMETNGGPWFTCALSDVPGIKQDDAIDLSIKGTAENFEVKNLPSSTRSEYMVKIGLKRI